MNDIENKIANLLRFARDNRGNENECANALALAQKLADANNLELMSINTAEKGRSGPRDDKKLNKGLYQYQRTLYKALADLNHCKIWIDKGTAKGSRYEIRLLGSRLNVTLVRNMADYIEDAANRFVRERMSHVHYFSKEAHLYREGVIDQAGGGRSMTIKKRHFPAGVHTGRFSARNPAQSNPPRTVSGEQFMRQSIAAEKIHRETIDRLKAEGYEVVEHTAMDASVFPPKDPK